MSDPKPRGGRPPLKPGEASTPIAVRVTTEQYDRAFAQSRRNRETIPNLLRRALDKLLDDEDDDE